MLTREVKTRRESVEAFRKGGREDLAAKEEAEIAILARLPARGRCPTTSSRRSSTRRVAATGAPARDMGKVMGWLSPRTAAGPTAASSPGSSRRRSRCADLAAHDTGHDPDGRRSGPTMLAASREPDDAASPGATPAG